MNSFPATLLAFRNVVSDCIRSLPWCWSIRQSSKVDWLVSFSKKLQTCLDNVLQGQLSRRRQNAMQFNQSDGSMELRHMRLNARQYYTARGYQPLLFSYSFSMAVVPVCLLLARVLQTMQVNLVWYTCELRNYSKTISYRLQYVCNQPGACTRACISHLNPAASLFVFMTLELVVSLKRLNSVFSNFFL